MFRPLDIQYGLVLMISSMKATLYGQTERLFPHMNVSCRKEMGNYKENCFIFSNEPYLFIYQLLQVSDETCGNLFASFMYST